MHVTRALSHLLARGSAVFRDCDYVRRYMTDARFWDRQTGCQGRDAHRSLASTLCDTNLGHYVAMCNLTVTIAHSTRTKSRHM